MRTIYTLLTVLFGTILFAQDYTPMLNDGKAWSVVYNYWTFEPEGMAYHDYQYRLTDETFSFNGKAYRAVEHRTRYRTDQSPPTPWSDWASDFYLFEDMDDRVVYVYYAAENHLHHADGEFLLYDFNLNVGDSVDFSGFNEVNGNGSENLIVAITNETVFGIENVRTYHVEPGEGFYPFKIYEGIGASTGLITLSLIIDAGWTLIDYGILNTVDLTKTKTKVYPNPFKDQIHIQDSEGIIGLELFNSNGQLISTGKTKDDLNAKLSGLNNGVYFLRIQTKNQSETIQLIKNK